MNIKKFFLLINFSITCAFAKTENPDFLPAGNDPKTYLYGLAAYALSNMSVKTITEAVNFATSVKNFVKPSPQYVVVPALGNVPRVNPMISSPYLKMQDDQLKSLVPEFSRRPIKVSTKIEEEINLSSLLWENRGKVTAVGTAILLGLGYKYRKKIKSAYIKLSSKITEKFKRNADLKSLA